MLKPQGRRGEVAAELHTDFPERFAERKRLYALAPDGHRRELELESHWLHKGRVVLKFRGVESISAAEGLAGCEIQIPCEQREQLEAGAEYISDLVGCKVFEVSGQPRELGTRGRYAAILASLVAFLSFDFFIVPPLYTFVIYRIEEWIALFVFLVDAILTGQLAAALRERAKEAREAA